MLQYNVYYVELLGDDPLKGVTIAVILDNKGKITDEEMLDTARLLNTYRTCFVTSMNKDNFSIRLFSVNGEIHDGFYGSIAAVYAVAETMCIREFKDSNNNYLNINTSGFVDKAQIIYKDSCHVGVRHELDISNISIKEEIELENFKVAVIENNEDPNFKSKIIYTNDGVTFSKLRKQKIEDLDINSDYMILYYDKNSKNAFFNIQRNPEKRDAYRINSRNQVAFIIKYLLLNGINPSDIANLNHIISTGQYAVIHVEVEEDKAAVSIDERILLEGIITI